MKILYHHRTLSKDGMDVHITELVAALRGRGHEVVLVAPKVADKVEFGSGGGLTSVVRAYLPGFITELLEFVYSYLAYRRLRKAYEEHKPDLVYERYNLFLLAGSELKNRTGCSLFVEVNAPLVAERINFGGLSLKRLARWCESRVWRSADMVLPVTSELADIIQMSGVAREHIQVVSNGVNPDRFLDKIDGRPIRLRYKLESAIVLGFVGFMRPWHGLDRILEVIAGWSGDEDIRLLIVGDGPVRPRLEALAQEREIENRLIITGVVPRDDVAGYIAAFDVALQPHAVSYASPLKLFEYMALGRAIIAPDQANIREILDHDQDAYLFDPHAPGSLEQAIRILASDASLRKRLGNSAAEQISAKNLTWEGNAQTIEQLARQVQETRNSI